MNEGKNLKLKKEKTLHIERFDGEHDSTNHRRLPVLDAVVDTQCVYILWRNAVYPRQLSLIRMLPPQTRSTMKFVSVSASRRFTVRNATFLAVPPRPSIVTSLR